MLIEGILLGLVAILAWTLGRLQGRHQERRLRGIEERLAKAVAEALAHRPVAVTQLRSSRADLRLAS